MIFTYSFISGYKDIITFWSTHVNLIDIWLLPGCTKRILYPILLAIYIGRD